MLRENVMIVSTIESVLRYTRQSSYLRLENARRDRLCHARTACVKDVDQGRLLTSGDCDILHRGHRRYDRCQRLVFPVPKNCLRVSDALHDSTTRFSSRPKEEEKKRLPHRSG